MHPPFQKGGCWNGCRKGCHYLWCTTLCFAESTIFLLLSGQTQHLQKTRFAQNRAFTPKLWVVVFQDAKGIFFLGGGVLGVVLHILFWMVGRVVLVRCCVFSSSIGFVVLPLCVWYSCKCVKTRVFQYFWPVWLVLFCVRLEGLGWPWGPFFLLALVF